MDYLSRGSLNRVNCKDTVHQAQTEMVWHKRADSSRVIRPVRDKEVKFRQFENRNWMYLYYVHTYTTNADDVTNTDLPFMGDVLAFLDDSKNTGVTTLKAGSSFNITWNLWAPSELIFLNLLGTILVDGVQPLIRIASKCPILCFSSIIQVRVIF